LKSEKEKMKRKTKSNSKRFEKYRTTKLTDKKTNFISTYLIFTHHKEYNKDCQRDIFEPMVNAYEKIYFSELTRLDVSDEKFTHEKIVDIFKKAENIAKERAYESLNGWENIWKEQNCPKVMSTVSDYQSDDWKWVIELRLDNSIESTAFAKLFKVNERKLLNKNKD